MQQLALLEYFIDCFILRQVSGDLNTTRKFVDSLRIPYLAPSFGGCESIVDPPTIMSYWYLSITCTHACALSFLSINLLVNKGLKFPIENDSR